MDELKFYFLKDNLYMILNFGLILVILKLGLKYLKNRNKKQIKKIDKSIYYRDIPCFGSIELAYWLLYNFSNINKNNLNNGLLGAYLLSWYKSGYIDIKHINKSEYSIDLKNENWEKNNIENKIYDFLKKASGNNNILEKNEIRKYCNKNKYEIKYMFKSILEEIKEELNSEEYITVTPSKHYILFTIGEKITLSNDLINEYQNLNGLKKFLSDYSNIKEKMHIEVQIWENYLIFANLLGIADEVKKQFRKINPDFNKIKAMTDVSFDNTIVEDFNIMYKSMKITFFACLGGLLTFCCLLFR